MGAGAGFGVGAGVGSGAGDGEGVGAGIDVGGAGTGAGVGAGVCVGAVVDSCNDLDVSGAGVVTVSSPPQLGNNKLANKIQIVSRKTHLLT